jgi:SAM-dependent methyltransferase
MTELLKTIGVLGPRRLLKLYRAHRIGWCRIISGFYTTRTMQALFNVGFFDALKEEGTVSAKSFAQSHGLDETILQSLCDSLYALGILRKEDSKYSLDSDGHLLVEVARGWFDGVYGYEEVFHSLEALLRKEKTYGKEINRRSDFIASGSGEMERWIYFPLAIDYIRKHGFESVLDLGCGDAAFLVDLCESLPAVTGCGIDISAEAVAAGKDRVKRASLEDRVQLLVEDISSLEKAPTQLEGIDVATTFFVLHEVLHSGDEAVVGLLRDFRRLFPGVPLLVFEVVRPTPEEMRRRPGMAVQYTLQHDLTNQRLVHREKWKELFKTAGFALTSERHLRFARTVIFTLC